MIRDDDYDLYAMVTSGKHKHKLVYVDDMDYDGDEGHPCYFLDTATGYCDFGGGTVYIVSKNLAQIEVALQDQPPATAESVSTAARMLDNYNQRGH